MPFQVSGTKKGGMPVTVEKRPKGKVATVIGNVRGDKAELLAMVKAAVGAGGSVAGHDSVEIQGDHAAKIQQLLLRHQDRTGHATMKGVAGLKPKPEKPEPRREEESRARREEKVRSAEVLAQQKQRRVEARQRAVREAVNAKVESTRHFHVYANMMKTWRYWDQNWDALRGMHDRHVRELDEAARAGRGRGITSILDAEVDEPEPGRRRGEVLEAIDRGLVALGGGAVAPGRRTSPESAARSPPPPSDQRAALMALGMIAAPSPFRQSRQERLAEAKRRQAAAKEAAKNAPPVAATAKESTRAPAFDPALAALRAFGDYPDRSRPAASASSRSRPPPVRPAATRPPPSRVPRGGAGRGGAVGIRRGGHGKGDPKRPSLGYTGARKGTGGGVYGGDVEKDRDVAFDSDESEEEEEEEDHEYSYAGGGDTRGWEASPGGGFSFGPIAGAENPPSWQQLPLGDEAVDEEMDQEESDLREALRRSLLEAESRRSEPTRRVGLHVECGDLWGELTEEEAFELAKRLSEEQEELDRASRAEYESFEPARGGSDFRDRVSEARDPRDRLAELCGVDANDEAAVGLADLVSSMDTLEEAADLVAATAGCDRGEAEEVAAALRDDGDEPETEEAEIEESSPADDDAAGFMPKCMDEDAALAEALRLSKLDAETRVAAPAFTDPAPAPSGDLLGWADAQLSMFTGEEDNAFLAEYVCDMETAAEIEEFLRESFPSENSGAAASFARALVLMRS